ncbi:transcriptional regulator [Pseudomonas syringae pv. actinidiae ICMP 19096]|uniref:Transcriptional regulator n=3 Tax=Pseudomonas syringae group TaxID=136849 RepID=A0A656K265_PSESF|nr:transcriptional regulator [Pseudomonas syringae pv. actinidiae ICMP 19096]
MLEPSHNDELPPIPGKRYFTIGEVSELCAVKPHVLRYWEQEFPQLNPVKRRGNRRYYQRLDVLMIRQIRGLLYDQGFTIGGESHRRRTEGRYPAVQADDSGDDRRTGRRTGHAQGLIEQDTSIIQMLRVYFSTFSQVAKQIHA